ncbi:glycosyltransferase family 4 protein [Candidatus Peribacteria bacterium]|nr:MAG: glycosyltransferase family 4 protein [Candidatus Peribacteria bacterium]
MDDLSPLSQAPIPSRPFGAPSPAGEGKLKLLFITQKLHGQDAFGILWINAFRNAGYDVQVICLEWRPEEAMAALGITSIPFTVHSLGKERGLSKMMQILTFIRLTFTLPFDRIFIHMAPVWGLLGAPAFILRRKPTYLWYTHYKMQAGLRLIGWYGKRMFCATPQSMPQYEGNPKKVVVGHGVDLGYWAKRPNVDPDPRKLLVVHRLSRSKRLELIIRALILLPEDFTLDVYGIEAEADYVAELKALVTALQLEHRVTFHGIIASKDLPALYVAHQLILNMASETIDKTMVEAMTCGCYPMTTKGNALAIGIPVAPETDTPEAIAAFILTYGSKAPIDANAMYEIVETRHSLKALIAKMDVYIHSGT